MLVDVVIREEGEAAMRTIAKYGASKNLNEKVGPMTMC